MAAETISCYCFRKSIYLEFDLCWLWQSSNVAVIFIVQHKSLTSSPYVNLAETILPRHQNVFQTSQGSAQPASCMAVRQTRSLVISLSVAVAFACECKDHHTCKLTCQLKAPAHAKKSARSCTSARHDVHAQMQDFKVMPSSESADLPHSNHDK